MADTLPSIDFNFGDLRERMAQFTARFDDFIERGRKRVLEERNAFRMNLADAEDQQRQHRQAIHELESKTTSHAHILSREAQEAEEMHEAIRGLTLQKEEHNRQRDHIKTEIESVQTAIRLKREAQAAHQRSLAAQSRHNVPELQFWESCLGMHLDGTGVDDRLRFVFDSSDEKEAMRDCWFELQIGQEQRVVNTKPRLERDDIEAAQESLQETKQLGLFIKTMRTHLLKALKQ
ncbi:hypothetical protein DOTSEDRAFT_141919 [Dothistroma septosporum NZE10]|uniref:Kinetochore protein SPC25 n=1 Tax=Dothistroma septosporum (strain NZE10 / CBS 128990) TaxID=675120 RepID=N1PYS4_DOTSN|nr:hypothetical protein DOTSEDRAFT_141919 [Dothistroma septosporum NZE10]